MLDSLKQTPGRRALLGEQLVHAGLVTREQIDEACARQAQSRKRLGEILLQMGYIAPPALGRVLEGAIRCRYIDLHDLAVDTACAHQVTEPRAQADGSAP